MAKLMLIGKVAQVKIVHNPLGGDVTAKCVEHKGRPIRALSCGWTETYDDLNDATESASDHADGAR